MRPSNIFYQIIFEITNTNVKTSFPASSRHTGSSKSVGTSTSNTNSTTRSRSFNLSISSFSSLKSKRSYKRKIKGCIFGFWWCCAGVLLLSTSFINFIILDKSRKQRAKKKLKNNLDPRDPRLGKSSHFPKRIMSKWAVCKSSCDNFNIQISNIPDVKVIDNQILQGIYQTIWNDAKSAGQAMSIGMKLNQYGECRCQKLALLRGGDNNFSQEEETIYIEGCKKACREFRKRINEIPKAEEIDGLYYQGNYRQNYLRAKTNTIMNKKLRIEKYGVCKCYGKIIEPIYGDSENRREALDKSLILTKEEEEEIFGDKIQTTTQETVTTTIPTSVVTTTTASTSTTKFQSTTEPVLIIIFDKKGHPITDYNGRHVYERNHKSDDKVIIKYENGERVLIPFNATEDNLLRDGKDRFLIMDLNSTVSKTFENTTTTTSTTTFSPPTTTKTIKRPPKFYEYPETQFFDLTDTSLSSLLTYSTFKNRPKSTTSNQRIEKKFEEKLLEKSGLDKKGFCSDIDGLGCRHLFSAKSGGQSVHYQTSYLPICLSLIIVYFLAYLK